jgi:hypothetical protein
MKAVKMKAGTGLLFRAIPDDGQVRVRVGASGLPVPLYPNLSILGNPLEDRLARANTTFWYPPSDAVEYRGAAWVVNFCADDDDYHDALRALDAAFGSSLPIFNHPRAVADSRRDRVAALLTGIPGLIVPRCIRLVPEAPGDFQKAFAAHGFRYPVLVRPATSQSAEGLVKVDTPFGWDAVFAGPWLRRAHYITEFVDTRRSTGDYLKLRVAFIGDEMMLRSHKPTRGWLNKGMGGATPAQVAEFLRLHESFHDWTALRQLAAALRDRLRLDFFGADLGAMEDGRFVLFEANAAMSMTDPTGITQDFEPQMRVICEKVKRSVAQLVAAPDKWRMQPSARAAEKNAAGTDPAAS